MKRTARIDVVAEEYLLWARTTKSVAHADKIGIYLPQFCRFVQEQGARTIASIARLYCQRYIQHLKNSDYAAWTIWGACSIARAFLNWCVAEGLIASPPTRHGDWPKMPENNPKPLTDAEMAILLQSTAGKDWMQRRDRAILLALLYCGMRRSELLQITVRHVEEHGGIVIQKGNRRHFVYIGDEVRIEINAYIRALKIQRGAELDLDGSLWRSRDMRPLSANGLRMIFRRLSKETGIDVWAHRLRATCATKRLANGMPTKVLEQALGWTDPRSIRAYVKLSNVDLIRLMDETSPLKHRK